MDLCDMCSERKPLKWVVVDDNYECEMCAKCIKSLRKECDVEVMMEV